MGAAVFISHASADSSFALTTARGIEGRGATCWIAGRDVKPGENYQEAIVAAIRSARAVVLIFSERANRSDEIKKELSLASRFGVPVIALRIAPVEPTDAFAYELATRQWIDAFPDREEALDAVARRLVELDGMPLAIPAPAARRWRRPWLPMVGILLLIVIGGASWMAWRGHNIADKSMQVRFAGFSRLSADIPAGIDEAMRDEMTAALDEEGVVKISTASAPPAGQAPAYALSGTIRRDGSQLRVVVRMIDERSGIDLWSTSFTYGADVLSRVPRLVAIDAGLVLRCGLFGVSTYPRAVPDMIFSDYLSACHDQAGSASDRTKALAMSRKVVAALPDFSWGWSGVAVSATQALWAGPYANGAALRQEARAAADRAVALDSTNSEALAWKSFAIDPAELVTRGLLLERAIAARPLSCGCEHNIYGQFLDEVGRHAEAVAEYRQAVGAMALEYYSQANLGIALVEAGQEREGREHVDASIELANDPAWTATIALLLVTVTQDYRAMLATLDKPATLPQTGRAAWRLALEALETNGKDRGAAVAGLAALNARGLAARITVSLLGALGADKQALDFAEHRARAGDTRARALLFLPSLAHARADVGFTGTAMRLGLVRYWRETRTRPDECGRQNAPAYCRQL